MLTLSWEPSTLTWPLTSPKFSHTPSKRAQANSHSSLTIPHHTLVRESLTSDTPPPSALASPVQPRRVGCGSTSFAPQTCTVHSYTPAAAGFTTSRDLPCRPPPPINLRTPMGSCLKLLISPPPIARGGLLSGYQEVRRGDKEEVLPRATMTYDPERRVAQSPCKRPHVASGPLSIPAHPEDSRNAQGPI